MRRGSDRAKVGEGAGPGPPGGKLERAPGLPGQGEPEVPTRMGTFLPAMSQKQHGGGPGGGPLASMCILPLCRNRNHTTGCFP